MEGTGCIVYEGIMVALAWIDRAKPQKPTGTVWADTDTHTDALEYGTGA